MELMRIFYAVQNFNWENPNLYQSLVDMGHDVIKFDWKAIGFDQYHERWHDEHYQFGQEQMNNVLLQKIEEVHKPIDLFFAYLSVQNITEDTLKAIRTILHKPMVNFSCNNVASFERTHQGIAHCFDLNWYVEKNVGHKFDKIGARSIHMPFGINPVKDLDLHNLNALCIHNYAEYDVSFIGQLYGYRLQIMAYLSNFFRTGIFSKISYEHMQELALKSRISLGFRGLGNATLADKHLKQIRLRDFEFPAIGAFYLCEYIEDLEDLFDIGKEIVCFKNVDEMVELIKKYIKDGDANLKIRQAGHKRIINEHTWDRRFNALFKELGLN